MTGCEGRIYNPNIDTRSFAPPPLPPTPTAIATLEPPSTVELSQFKSKTECKTCHIEQVKEWELSSHSRAMTDPVYQALVLRLQRETPGAQAECLPCHSNIGTLANSVGEELLFDGLDSLVLEGVSCESCHKLSDQSGQIELDPKVPLQAPESPLELDPAHPIEQSLVISSASMCGSCHDVESESGLQLEQPYLEWTTSPARREDKSCLDCHMDIENRPVSNLGNQNVIYANRNHSILGPGALMPEAVERSPDGLQAAEKVRELLREQASLEVSVLEEESFSNTLRLLLVVEHHSNGHRFPTGSVFFRQLWIQLLIDSGEGEPVVALLEPEDLESPENVTKYGALFLSGKLFNAYGERTLFPWQAEHLENSALEPRERRPIELNIPIPEGTRGPLQVRARLLFRTYPPQLISALSLPIEQYSTTLELDSHSLDVNW